MDTQVSMFPTHLLPDWKGKIILGGRRGSYIDNTNTPASDQDFFAVWVHPVTHYYGLNNLVGSSCKRRELHYQKEEDGLDLLVVDLPRYVQYLANNNPAYHKWLWAGGHTSILGPGGQTLLGSRKFMVTEKLINAFWFTGIGLYQAEEYIRALRCFEAAHRLNVQFALYAGTHQYSKKIQESKITGDDSKIQVYCASFMDCGKPVWEEPRFSTRDGSWEFYNKLTKFAMVQAWDLSLEGREVK